MRDVEEPPDTRRLYTPMLAAGCGVRLALFRDRHGEACAVGFSSAEALERVLGTARYEAWPLGRVCLRELAEARGVRRILVDPVFAAAVVSSDERERTSAEVPTPAARRMDPQVAGALAVCAVAGAAAVFLGELR